MFKTLATLINGANARSEDRVRDAFAIELIDQKIREAEGSLKAAKVTLASLIQRQRSETRMRDNLENKVADLLKRAQAALDDDREDMAQQAAQSIASMENELEVRRDTLARLEQKILRLRTSIEAGHRRIIDLKQGAIQARAVRREQDIQTRMHANISATSSVAEAEELIGRVLGRDDPFEQTQILADIDESLSHDGVTNRLADAGYGHATRSTADDVLARLKSKSK